MAVIYKCDLCGREYSATNGEKSPLYRENFEYPDAEYSGWTAELCDYCLRELKDALVKARYDFWKNRSEKE